MWEIIRSNHYKSYGLMTAMGTLMILGGVLIGMLSSPDAAGAVSGGLVAFAIFAVMFSVTWFGGAGMMLHFSGAREAERKDCPVLFNVVEEMCVASGLPMPKVYIINDTAPNAFATGRTPETSAVAVTRGLLMKLNRYELQGVIAHEMSHIKNRDILYMIVTGVMLGVIVMLADGFLRSTRHLMRGVGRGGRSKGGGGQLAVMAVVLVLMLLFSLLAPIVARMLYFSVSRRREYLADACACEMTRYPDALADALEKIHHDQEVLEVANRATAGLFIVNPIKKFEARAKSMISTHPPIEERVKILRAMGRGGNASFLAYNDLYKQLSSYHAREIVPSSVVKRSQAVLPVLQPLENLKKGARTPQQQMERLRDIQHLVWGVSMMTGVMACACGHQFRDGQFEKLKKFHEEVTGNVPGVARCPRCLETVADPADRTSLDSDAKGIITRSVEIEREEAEAHDRSLHVVKEHPEPITKFTQRPK